MTDSDGEAVLRAARRMADAEGFAPVRCDAIGSKPVTASEAARPES